LSLIEQAAPCLHAQWQRRSPSKTEERVDELAARESIGSLVRVYALMTQVLASTGESCTGSRAKMSLHQQAAFSSLVCCFYSPPSKVLIILSSFLFYESCISG
jgi:hypothetical protein